MFEFLRSRRPAQPGLALKQLVAAEGLEAAVDAAAQLVIQTISKKQVAHEFILQELDGSSQGNDYAQFCAQLSGFEPHEYKGALTRSVPEVDGAGGPQQLLLALSLQLADDPEQMAKFRCDVGSVVQKHFKLGLHSPNYDAYGKIFGNDR